MSSGSRSGRGSHSVFGWFICERVVSEKLPKADRSRSKTYTCQLLSVHWPNARKQMSDSLAAEIASLTARLSALSAPTADVLAACKALGEVCEEVQQPSQLIRLPPELLLCVLRELDSKALAKLSATARFFHSSALLERACDEVAEFQHGSVLAALRPQKLTAVRRLRSLEEAIEKGPEFMESAAQGNMLIASSDSSGQTFQWPLFPTYTLADADAGGYMLATLLSARDKGAIKPTPQEIEEDNAAAANLGADNAAAANLGAENAAAANNANAVDRAHIAAVNLAVQLVEGPKHNPGVQPISPSGAVAFC